MSRGRVVQQNRSTLESDEGRTWPGVSHGTGDRTHGRERSPGVSHAPSEQVNTNLNLESQRGYALILTTGVLSAAGSSLDPTDPRHRNGTMFGEAWVIQFSTGAATVPTAISQTNIGNVIGGPTGGQTGVPINAVIRVGFEKAMSASTINTTTITLRKSSTGAAVPVTVTYDDVANTAVITPTAPLEYSTSYTLALTGLLDILGDPLP